MEMTASEAPPAARSAGIAALRTGSLVFTLSLVLYVTTAAPTVLWGDSAKLTILAMDRTPLWNDLAGGHPLHTLVSVLIAGLIPTADFAFRLNCVSALFGSATCGVITASVALSTRSERAAVFAGVALAVSHTHWHLSVIAESYTLAMFLVALSLLLIVNSVRSANNASLLQVGAGMLLGTAILANALPAFMVPGFAFASSTNGGLRGASRFLVGFTISSLGVVTLTIALGDSSAFGRIHAAANTYVNAGSALTGFALIAPLIAYQFAGPMLGAICAGIARESRDRVAIGCTFSAVVVGAFASTYMRQRRFNILIAAYVLLAYVGGVYLGRRQRQIPSWLIACHVSVALAAYAITPVASRLLGIDLVRARPAPGRSASFFLQPWKYGASDAAEWSRAALGAVPPESTILADFTLARPLIYIQRRERLRPDVSVIETDSLIVAGQDAFLAEITRLAAEGDVALAGDYPPYYFIDAVREQRCLERCGPLWCVVRAQSPPCTRL